MLPFQSPTGIRRRQGLAKPEMICAIQRRKHSGRTIDLLEVGEVVLGSQVHAPVPMHPAVSIGPRQEDHGLGKGRTNLEHRTISLREVSKKRGKVAAANIAVEQQLSQGNCGDPLGEGGASQQRAGEVIYDCIGYGTADQIHPADELDALLRLVVQLENEPEDVAGIDEADNYDIARSRQLIVKDCLADARLNELGGSGFCRIACLFRPPGSATQRPEVPLVVFQDIQLDWPVQG